MRSRSICIRIRRLVEPLITLILLMGLDCTARPFPGHTPLASLRLLAPLSPYERGRMAPVHSPLDPSFRRNDDLSLE